MWYRSSHLGAGGLRDGAGNLGGGETLRLGHRLPGGLRGLDRLECGRGGLLHRKNTGIFIVGASEYD
jgi:hypothetical protein